MLNNLEKTMQKKVFEKRGSEFGLGGGGGGGVCQYCDNQMLIRENHRMSHKV